MGWNMSPVVIWVKIADIDEALQNTRYELKPDSHPELLINILSELFGMQLREYHEKLISWMEDHMLEHPIAEQWWHSKGQDWPYYLTVLQSNITPDGLELWCACVASRTHLTFIQHGQVWSTQADGLHDDDYTVMWLVEGAVYCNIYLYT